MRIFRNYELKTLLKNINKKRQHMLGAFLINSNFSAYDLPPNRFEASRGALYIVRM